MEMNFKFYWALTLAGSDVWKWKLLGSSHRDLDSVPRSGIKYVHFSHHPGDSDSESRVFTLTKLAITQQKSANQLSPK